MLPLQAVSADAGVTEARAEIAPTPSSDLPAMAATVETLAREAGLALSRTPLARPLPPWGDAGTEGLPVQRGCPMAMTGLRASRIGSLKGGD